MRRRFLGLVVVAATAGCSSGDVMLRDSPAGYLRDLRPYVAAADWSRTEDVTVELSEFRIRPAALVFRERSPVRLIIRNVGTRTHAFVSEGFFKAIAAQKLVSAHGEVGFPYIQTIEVRPGEEKQLYFVPVTKGSYPLECSIPFHAAFGMEGMITVR